MKFIRRFSLYLMLAVIHFLLQSSMMMISFASQLFYYEESLWSVGGMLVAISGTLYQIFAFPFVWIFDKFGLTVLVFQDLPYFLNSLLWATFGYYVVTRRSKNFRRNPSRYKFIRG